MRGGGRVGEECGWIKENKDRGSGKEKGTNEEERKRREG